MSWKKKIQQLFSGDTARLDPLIRGDLQLEGDFHFMNSGTVEGTLRGDISSSSLVHYWPAADHQGNITAEAITFEGLFTGEARATGHVSLQRDARVHGPLTGGSLEIADSAEYEGSLDIGSPDA